MCNAWFVGVCQPDGEDDLKRRQLMELAIINGTYRDTATGVAANAALSPAASVLTAVPVPVSRKSFLTCLRSDFSHGRQE